MCAAAKCSMDRFARWSFTGLTHRAYVLYMRHTVRIAEAADRFSAALHDKLLKTPERPLTEEDRRRIAANPLEMFPDDVDYAQFPDEAVAQRAQAAAEYLASRPPEYELTLQEMESLWTPARVAALRGSDKAAKRASVSGRLWAVYCTMLRHRGTVDVDLLRQVVAKDIALLKLCPSIAEASQYNAGKPQSAAFNFRADMVEVPAEHVAKLIREKRLLPLLREVAAGCKLPALLGVVHA